MTTAASASTPKDGALRVGWVGLGDQGAPMARAIAEAGFELHVWVRRDSSLAALEGLPHIRHATPAALGAVSDVVGLCLEVAELDAYARSGANGLPMAARLVAGVGCGRSGRQPEMPAVPASDGRSRPPSPAR